MLLEIALLLSQMPRSLAIDVLEQRVERGRRGGLGFVDGGMDFLPHQLLQGRLPIVIPEPPGPQVAPKPGDRVALPPRLGLCAFAIPRVVIGSGMRALTVADTFDQSGPAPAPSPVDCFEQRVELLHLDEFGARHPVLRQVLAEVRPDDGQLFGLFVRQRAHENGIDDAENSGVRADSPGRGSKWQPRQSSGSAGVTVMKSECLERMFSSKSVTLPFFEQNRQDQRDRRSSNKIF